MRLSGPLLARPGLRSLRHRWRSSASRLWANARPPTTSPRPGLPSARRPCAPGGVGSLSGGRLSTEGGADSGGGSGIRPGGRANPSLHRTPGFAVYDLRRRPRLRSFTSSPECPAPVSSQSLCRRSCLNHKSHERQTPLGNSHASAGFRNLRTSFSCAVHGSKLNLRSRTTASA